MKQKKLLTKAVCFSAAFVMLLMSLTLEPGIDLLNSWLRSSAEDSIIEDNDTSILTNDDGYVIVDSPEDVTIPTEVTFTWEEVSESSEEEVTPEPTTLTGDNTSRSDNADQTGGNENSEGNSAVTEPGDESQLADEDDISSLNSAIGDSKEYDSANYTSSSWQNFQNELSDANSILEDYNNNGTVLKNDVVNVINKIQSAIDNLVSIKELSELVKEAECLIESDYTSESFEAVTSNFTNAITVKENPDATQNEVNDAVTALRTAVESLVKKSYTLSWNSKYVTAFYQDGDNKVEIINEDTEIAAGTEVNVELTSDGQKIYSSITVDKASSEDEDTTDDIPSYFVIDNGGEAKAKLTLLTTTVINNINIEGSDAPTITLPDDSDVVSYGQIIKVTPTAAYSVQVNKKDLITEEKYVCALGANELTFTAVANSFDINLIDDVGNYFKVDGTDENGKASYNSTVTLTPNYDNCNGINIESLLDIDNVKVYADDDTENNLATISGNTITFKMPASSVTISATATPVKYSEITTENCTVETTTEENGAIEFNEGYAKFTVKPNDGYKIQEVKVNDKEVSPDDATGEINNIDEAQYTFSNDGIYSDVSVSATCEAVKYGTITSTSEYGTVEVTTDESGAIEFDDDGNTTFTVMPNTSDQDKVYIIKSVKVNDKEVSTKSVNENGVWTVTFSNLGIHDDVNISVEYFVAITLEIDGTDGKSSTSVTDSYDNKVEANYNYSNNGINIIDVTAQAGTGYHIVSFSEKPSEYKDTENAEGANNEPYYTKATAVYSDVGDWTETKTITVTFAIDTFNITTEKSTGNGNGEISVPKSPINYDNNSETTDATVTVTPNNDSYVSKIVVKDTVTNTNKESIVFDTSESQNFANKISLGNDDVQIVANDDGSVNVKFLTVKSDYEVTATFAEVEEVTEEVSITVKGNLSDDLDSSVNYKYIIGGTNDVDRSSLELLSVSKTDYSVSYIIGDVDTTINSSISYADSCSVTGKDISFEKDTTITFYLRNNFTYKVTKFTVTLVPDNEKPEIVSLTADPASWTKGKVTISGEVSDNLSGVSEVYWRKGNNGNFEKLTDTDFSKITTDESGNITSFTVTVDEQNYNGVYQFYCVDRAGNTSIITNDNGASEYKEVIVQQDITNPEIISLEANPKDWTKGKVTISGKVSDNLSGVSEVYWRKGNNGNFEKLTDTDFSKITTDESGNITSFTVTVDEQNYNGVYQFYCVDRAGNTSMITNDDGTSEYKEVNVYQDITAPKVDSITINKTLLDTILTFGFYQAPIKVIITASDPEPDEDADAVSGVKSIKYSYEGTEGKYSSVTVSESKTVPVEDNKISFTIDSDFRGTITAKATDNAGNESEEYRIITGENADGSTVELDRIVSDKTAPTREVTYSTPKQVVDKDTLITKKDFDLSSENSNSILYYDGNATLTIAITEANFYAEDVTVTVNDKVAKLDGKWKTNGDVHTNTITLSGDGDYVVKMEYTDRSENVMKSYESEKIVIDTIDPVVKVEYDNNDVKNTVDERQYFDKQRTATITVTEHNFRADDIVVTVSAVDVTGKNVSVTDYSTYLSTRSNWTHNGDVHTATITYSVDANYTFDIAYNDLALRDIGDYSEDKFTVDKTAPYDLKVTYENEPENTVGSTRYYGEQVHVMISSVDDTSPIYRFEYEGKLTQDDPISAVNRGVLQTVIESKTSEITREVNLNKVDFYIPKELLNENNSFDGNVYFKAYDCAENNTDTTDATRLVTDKIAPTATVTFNGSEYTQKEYFNTNIDVNININEANFNSNDVIVSVTKDGSSYSGYSVKWNSSSVDSHLGSFTLTEDGDYVVKVTYTDKSGNKMQDYTSPVIVLDTVNPVVEIDQINGESAHESAHNDETIGIKVSVTDKNIVKSGVKLKLTAITNKSTDGTFDPDIKDITFVEPTTSEDKTVLTYTIDNLEMDGYYTLTCIATDLAKNENLDQTNEKHIIDDGKVKKEDIHFSVNRNGSVFYIEATRDGKTVDDINKNLNNQYLNAKVSVTFHEINVDPLSDENSTQKTLIKDNKEISDPNVEYSNDEVGSGGWYERKYTYQEENFEDDGRYTLRITTTDKSGNVNDSSTDDKSAVIHFTIDRTAPIIYSNVVEEQIDDGKYQGKTINKAEQTVEISFAEPNLDVEKLRIVRADGENEEEIGDIHDLLDENNVVRFIENNVLNDNIKVIAYDLAGNKSTYDIVDLTVTTNIFALWYANALLFWSSIIGFIVLAGLFILFIILKKRRKSKEDE